MKYSKSKLFYLALTFLFSLTALGQVGIATTAAPKGALEIGSTTSGLVYPVVSLSGITTETISNPSAANIIAGTTVYNTNTINNGVDSLYPGLYTWNGSRWIPQFDKKDNKLFLQNTDVRTESILTNQAIGFTGNSFTPKYSGNYIVVLRVHFGGGTTDNFGGDATNNPAQDQFVNFIAQNGLFNFTFGTTSYSFAGSSFSGYNNQHTLSYPNKLYTNTLSQRTITIERTLSADIAYSFALNFTQALAPGFLNDGNIGDGRGYITTNFPNNMRCSIEVNFVGE